MKRNEQVYEILHQILTEQQDLIQKISDEPDEEIKTMEETAISVNQSGFMNLKKGVYIPHLFPFITLFCMKSFLTGIKLFLQQLQLILVYLQA